MFISFQPQVFHNPPVGNNQNQLIWAGPEIWFDVTFRGEVLDGSEASAGCCWAEGDDLLEKQNGKVGWAVVVFGCWCFFWMLILGENLWKTTKKKHPSGWKTVRFWMIPGDGVFCLVSLPNKNTHKKLKKMSMFLRFDIYVCFRKFSDAVTIFLKVILAPSNFGGNFRPKILRPSLNLPCWVQQPKRWTNNLQPLTGVKLSRGKCVNS